MDSFYKILSRKMWKDLSMLKQLVATSPITIYSSGSNVDILIDDLSIYMITVGNEQELEETLEVLSKIFIVEEIII